MTSPPGSSVSEVLSVGGVELEVLRRGSGRPLLLLHGFQNVDPRAPFLDLLGRHAEIIAPSHPGFGHSPRPAVSTRSTTSCTSISTCSRRCRTTR